MNSGAEFGYWGQWEHSSQAWRKPKQPYWDPYEEVVLVYQHINFAAPCTLRVIYANDVECNDQNLEQPAFLLCLQCARWFPLISLHSLFGSGLWSLDGNLMLRKWYSTLITVETDVWKHKTVLAENWNSKCIISGIWCSVTCKYQLQMGIWTNLIQN